MKRVPSPVIKKIPFTQGAYDQLKADFARLTEKRKETMIRLQTAREMGDLSENGAYIYAKMELGSLGRQLGQLRRLLDTGIVVSKKANSDVVSFGCTVTLVSGTKKVVYMMVSVHESNLDEHKLSTDSPLGKAIMGKKVGDKVTVKTPNGEVEYQIKEIK